MPNDTVTPLKITGAALIVALGISFIAFAFGGKDAAQRDYLCYWAAGQQLAHHSNPYDGATVFNLERSVGYPGTRPFLMRNPPIIFPLVLPLGFIGLRIGSVLWSLAIVACLMVSVRLLWVMQGKPDDRLFMAAYLFVPIIPCLHQGQTGIFLLLGLVLFLYFRESMPFVAGAALLLPLFKPHLFLPFGVALLGWIITRKAYRLLAGFATATACAGLFSYLLDPACWSQYARMVKLENIGSEFIPTLSLAFRYTIHRETVWLQAVPAAIGCLWAAFYFIKNQNDWNWSTHGSLVLLVSVMVAPYSWLPDESVVLPAIVTGLYLASKKGRSLIPFCVITAIAFMELAANFSTNSGAFLWTSPVWLAWYLWITRRQPSLYEAAPPANQLSRRSKSFGAAR